MPDSEPLVTGYTESGSMSRRLRRRCLPIGGGRAGWCCGGPGRLSRGSSQALEHVAADPEALRFQFMNRVMRDQRIASQVAAERASDASVTLDQARAKVAERGPGRLRGVPSSWRSS